MPEILARVLAGETATVAVLLRKVGTSVDHPRPSISIAHQPRVGNGTLIERRVESDEVIA